MVPVGAWPVIEMTGVQLGADRYSGSGAPGISTPDCTAPRRLLVIYGDRDPGDDLIHKMNTRKDKYDISGKVHIREGEEKIHADDAGL